MTAGQVLFLVSVAFFIMLVVGCILDGRGGHKKLSRVLMAPFIGTLAAFLLGGFALFVYTFWRMLGTFHA